MRTLTLLAVLALVASPAFASACCCDAMNQTGHAHSHAAQSHDHDSHDHEIAPHEVAKTSVEAHDSNARAVAFNGVCESETCEVAPPLMLDNSRHSFLTPLLTTTVAPFSSPISTISSVVFARDFVSQPRAPDRFWRSGLSPPTLSRS